MPTEDEIEAMAEEARSIIEKWKNAPKFHDVVIGLDGKPLPVPSTEETTLDQMRREQLLFQHDIDQLSLVLTHISAELEAFQEALDRGNDELIQRLVHEYRKNKRERGLAPSIELVMLRRVQQRK